MRIVTFNVNSIRARLHLLPDWLDRARPDVLCLQELKCEAADFPMELFAARGYHVALHGQKTYNGVAIASLTPLDDVRTGLPLAGDAEARGIAVRTAGLHIVNLYVVNGKAVGDPKYDHKLRWLDALVDWVARSCTPEEALVVCGDFNIAPTDDDTWDPAAWHGEVLCSEAERAPFRRLLDWGLHDAFRALYPTAFGRYAHTWWDYRGAGFPRGHGLRIDHHLVSASVLARAAAVEIDRDMRKSDKASDHAPVTLVLRGEGAAGG